MSTVARNPEPARRWNPSDTLILAITPAIAYAVAFQIEKGWAIYFGYPANWISLEFNDVLIAWLWLILFSAVPFFGLVFFSALLPRRPARVLLFALWRPAFGIIGALLILRGTDFLGIASIVLALVVALGAIVMLYYELVFPARNRRRGESLLDAIERYHRDETDARRKAPFLPWPSLGDNPHMSTAMGMALLGLVAILILLGIPEFLGRVRARDQSDFATLTGNPRYVLLRRYADNHIAQQLDSTGRYLEPVFKLIPVSDSVLGRLEMHHFERLIVRGYHTNQLPSVIKSPGDTRSSPPTDTGSKRPLQTRRP